ncbi:MAG: glycosyltransferase [Rhodospirillales bacterium]|nr:glycosyltransferase [Rhodospirillales bacterium]
MALGRRGGGVREADTLTMRVLQVMAGAEFGGAEAFFTRLILALDRAGLDQRVVIRGNWARAQVLRDGGIEPVELPFGGLLDWRTPRVLKRQIKVYRPDVVLTWMNRATRMCPKGDFVHVGRLGGYYDLKYYQNCDHLIGNTKDIRDYLVGQGWEAEKAHYLPNFVSEEKADPVPRRQFFTPDGASLVLGLGRLHQNKAFDVLLDAASRVPNVYLWIAGDGPLKEELEKQAENLAVKPRTRFLGWREDTAALLAAADIFVCPSRHEPLGNVVIEAWAQGVPVIAADSYGPGTLIEHRETGILVPVDDSATMGRAIRNLLEDDTLRKHIAKNGHQAYQEAFTEKIVIKQYMDFLQSIQETA